MLIIPPPRNLQENILGPPKTSWVNTDSDHPPLPPAPPPPLPPPLPKTCFVDWSAMPGL